MLIWKLFFLYRVPQLENIFKILILPSHFTEKDTDPKKRSYFSVLMQNLNHLSCSIRFSFPLATYYLCGLAQVSFYEPQLPQI